MRKPTSLALVAVMAISLAACGGGASQTPGGGIVPPIAGSTPTPHPTATPNASRD